MELRILDVIRAVRSRCTLELKQINALGNMDGESVGVALENARVAFVIA